MNKEKYIFAFEKLDVWKNSIEFAELIYKITESFPDEEKFGIISQLRRAAVSIPSNLAEGSDKQSLKDQSRFSEISFGSLMEVLNQLIISLKLKYIEEKDYFFVREKIENLSRQINSFKNSQIRRSNEK